jgi:[ribosomal protein S5]-alanine N-acetyltransferase
MLPITSKECPNNLCNYFLCSERLGFRLWNKNDYELAKELWGNEKVTKYIGGPFTDDQIKLRLEKEISNHQQFKVQYWPMFSLIDGKFIGCCGLRPYKPEENILEIGFHICEKSWGAGYGRESANAIIKYAFDVLKVSGLFAGHNPENEVSKILLTKLGFQYTHDEFYKPTGLYHPSYLLQKDNCIVSR